MATYDEICKATKSAWDEFETTLKKELGDDFDAKSFWNIAGSGIRKVNDYVMQATDFGVNCHNCSATLDSDGTCWNCDNTSDVSVV